MRAAVCITARGLVEGTLASNGGGGGVTGVAKGATSAAAAAPPPLVFTWAWLMKRNPPTNLEHMISVCSNLLGFLGVFTGIYMWQLDKEANHNKDLTEKAVRWLNGGYALCVTDSPTLIARRLCKLREEYHPTLVEEWQKSNPMDAAKGMEPPSYGELWYTARNRPQSNEKTESTVWKIEELRVKLKHIALTAMDTYRANPERLEMLRPFLTHAPLDERTRKMMVTELEILDKARALSHGEDWTEFRSPMYDFLLDPYAFPTCPAEMVFLS
jgi:hypothetical protein